MTDARWHADQLAAYPYVECGALGHVWDFVGGLGSRKRPPPFGEAVTLRCMRCGKERWDVVQRESRELLARSYSKQDERWAKGERPKRIDFLLMSIDEKRRKRVSRRTSITSTVPAKPVP